MDKSYSRHATQAHIRRVQELIRYIQQDLDVRSKNHDGTMLVSEEVEKPDHHYALNKHHPEHHENGIKDMNLIDLLEMLLRM